MLYRKILSLFIILLMLTSTSAIGEKVMWLTETLTFGLSWDDDGRKVYVYDCDTEELSHFEIPAKAMEMYFINGEHNGYPLVAVLERAGLSIYEFDAPNIGNLVCRVKCNPEEHDPRLWALSYFDGELYAIEYRTDEEGYIRYWLVRFASSEKETICALPQDYYVFQTSTERLLVSEGNHFARAGSQHDPAVTHHGIYFFENTGGEYHQKFINLFDAIYPYDNYFEQKYHTIAPAMLWLDNENLLCFLVRQEIDDGFWGTSYNDAVVVNIHSEKVTPYLNQDGTPLVIKDHILAGYPVLAGEKMILNVQDGFSYPPAWYLTSLPDGVGSVSLLDGSISPIVLFNRAEFHVLADKSVYLKLP